MQQTSFRYSELMLHISPQRHARKRRKLGAPMCVDFESTDVEVSNSQLQLADQHMPITQPPLRFFLRFPSSIDSAWGVSVVLSINGSPNYFVLLPSLPYLSIMTHVSWTHLIAFGILPYLSYLLTVQPGPIGEEHSDESVTVLSALGHLIASRGIQSLNLRGNTLRSGGVDLLVGAFGTGCTLQALDVWVHHPCYPPMKQPL